MPYEILNGDVKPLQRTAEEVLEIIKRENVQFIDLQFTDFPGRLQHVTVPARAIDLDAFSEGVPKLDGSSIRGFVSINESDMVLVPDPNTFAIIPWIPEDIKTARLLCDVHWGFGQGRFLRDPRAIAQRAEQYLKEMGFDYSYWGPEVEFFVFDRVSWDVLSGYKGQSYEIESREAAWNTSGTGYPIRFKEGYYPAPPHDTLMEYRSRVCQTLERYFGIATDAHHHEVATAGQVEIDMFRDTLVSMADSVVTYKFVAKNMAKNNGMMATFMPKPLFMDNASGMHIHVSIWKDGENLFYDPNDEYAELSEMGRYFVGGIMAHSRALAAIVCPSTNSYRRLVPGFEAPVYIAWSRRNRSANVRVPVYQRGPQHAGKKRVEFRTPDPSCNPYLAFSAILAAGLDGVKNRIDPGQPVDQDIYELDRGTREKLGIGELPGSLREAAQALEADSDFLKPIFTDDAVEKVLEQAFNDHGQVAMRPHAYEFYLYFDI